MVVGEKKDFFFFFCYPLFQVKEIIDKPHISIIGVGVCSKHFNCCYESHIGLE